MENEIRNTQDAIINEAINDEAYIANGTIYKAEKRSTIQKMKMWYYKHIIATGKSAKWEERTETLYKIEKGAVTVLGAAAGLGLLIFPGTQLEGALTLLATPALIQLLKIKADIEKSILIKAKRAAEKAMGFENEGHSPKVEEPKITKEELIKLLKSTGDFIKKIPVEAQIEDLTPAVVENHTR